MNTTIKVTHRTAYGQDRFDPISPLSVTMAKLCNQTTLTREQLKLLDNAGFTIEVVAKPVSFK